MSKLDKVMGCWEKKYNTKVIPARELCAVKKLQLDSPSLNFIFGGGFPLGRICMLHGPESGGKSTLATYIAAQIQQKYEGHNTVLYLDFENTFELQKKLASDLCEDIWNYVAEGLDGLRAMDFYKRLNSIIEKSISDSLINSFNVDYLGIKFSQFVGMNSLSLSLKKFFISSGNQFFMTYKRFFYNLLNHRVQRCGLDCNAIKEDELSVLSAILVTEYCDWFSNGCDKSAGEIIDHTLSFVPSRYIELLELNND